MEPSPDLKLGDVRLEHGLAEPRLDPEALADMAEPPHATAVGDAGLERDGRGDVTPELAALASTFGHDVAPTVEA